MRRQFDIALAATMAIVLMAIGLIASQLPAFGAGALLFPSRRVAHVQSPSGCVDKQFAGVDVALAGWECATSLQPRRATIVFLHGIADNRSGALLTIESMVPRGFDVVAYDGRAHGVSGGDRCTYGYVEKHDLRRVLDQINAERVILIGHSLGAAIALQAAAIDDRVRAVVSIATFSDLRTVASERVPYVPAWSLGPAFARAERDGQFVINDVSPPRAAARINVPILLVHGEQDLETRPDHSRRVYAALRDPKRLLLVPNAGHNDVVNARVWSEIQAWIEALDP